MKDKYFDRPQKFDAEDEAFFQKHFGQRNSDSSASETAASGTESNTAANRRANDNRRGSSARPSSVPAGNTSGRPRTQQPAGSRPATSPNTPRRSADPAAVRRNNSAGSSSAGSADRTPSSDHYGSVSGSSGSSAGRGAPQPQRRRVSPEEAQRIAAQQRRIQQQRAAASVQSSTGARPSSARPESAAQRPQSGQTRPSQTATRRKTSAPPPPPRKKKKHHLWLLWLLLLIVLLVAAVVGFGKQPIRETAGAGERTAGVSTFVLAGTDAEDERTDTILLVSIDQYDHEISMMSIPRDTYVDAPYSVPKINSAYGYAGGGKKGMSELLNQISNIIGFMPDGYILVDLNDFVSIVNFMGGVDFDVPMDMDYEDPTQNLSIHLKAGEQHLNGREAIQLVRFRSGYADADLGRTSVQRDFMQAALKQWTSPLKIWRIPFLTVMIATRIRTDMSLGNLGWIGRVGLLSHTGDIQMDLLPGEPQYIGSGSYYVADESAARALMQQSYSPYR